jgi:hypothetical protein
MTSSLHLASVKDPLYRKKLSVLVGRRSFGGGDRVGQFLVILNSFLYNIKLYNMAESIVILFLCLEKNNNLVIIYILISKYYNLC